MSGSYREHDLGGDEDFGVLGLQLIAARQLVVRMHELGGLGLKLLKKRQKGTNEAESEGVSDTVWFAGG